MGRSTCGHGPFYVWEIFQLTGILRSGAILCKFLKSVIVLFPRNFKFQESSSNKCYCLVMTEFLSFESSSNKFSTATR